MLSSLIIMNAFALTHTADNQTVLLILLSEQSEKVINHSMLLLKPTIKNQS